MTKIVVAGPQDFSEEQRLRLEKLGDVTYYDTISKDGADYLERVKGADIICSGTAGLREAYRQLKDVYVTVAFVSVAFVDVGVLKKNKVTISNAPGANKYAVSEWIMAMTTLLMRDLFGAINLRKTYRQGGNLPPTSLGLAGSKMTILGQGNVGKQVGKLAEVYDMQVSFFNRGDDLKASVADADVVVNTLSSNPTTHKLLDAKFFNSLKQGAYLVTVTRDEIIDQDAMLEALGNGKLSGVASDCGGILVGDTEDPLYQKLLAHPKALVTPHIAYNSKMSHKMGVDIMIDNVEAWVNGNPQNVVAD
jgi:phosphoglycerate dehydrogenase-like enzyme